MCCPRKVRDQSEPSSLQRAICFFHLPQELPGTSPFSLDIVSLLCIAVGFFTLLRVQLEKNKNKKKSLKPALLLPLCPVPVVPWLEPDTRRKYPGGRGNRRLPGHLHLCALQRPGYHGHVPPSHIGAKGRFVVSYAFQYGLT